MPVAQYCPATRAMEHTLYTIAALILRGSRGGIGTTRTGKHRVESVCFSRSTQSDPVFTIWMESPLRTLCKPAHRCKIGSSTPHSVGAHMSHQDGENPLDPHRQAAGLERFTANPFARELTGLRKRGKNARRRCRWFRPFSAIPLQRSLWEADVLDSYTRHAARNQYRAFAVVWRTSMRLIARGPPRFSYRRRHVSRPIKKPVTVR